ncbi:MAG: hypothetical protein IT317_06050 [Anaerolineales bacterium]|nr:hypothetical protein [Anaerolineales bacterium]
MSLPPSPTVNRLIKPTLKTKYHIDFDWWERESRELRVYLTSHLCAEHQAAFASLEAGEVVDVIDPETAEIRAEDGVQHTLRTHCSQQPDFITAHTSLVDAVFRVFITNGNQPLSPEELADRIGRSGQANTILRTLSGARVYKGLRPVY